jgi:hypothetical protein
MDASIKKMPCPFLCQLQMSTNFFQAPAPPSHSARLTCVSTARWSHLPSESSNHCSLHPPNMDASSGKTPHQLLYLFMSNCKQVKTSSKHQLLPRAPLACLVFRLLDGATHPANYPTIANYTLQTWMLTLGTCHANSYTYFEQLQVSQNFFQAPAPPSCSTHLTCVSTARWSHAPSELSNYC